MNFILLSTNREWIIREKCLTIEKKEKKNKNQAGLKSLSEIGK